MTTRTRKPRFSWDKVSLADQRKTLEAFENDGHTIWDATAMFEHDSVPPSVLQQFTRTQKSDGSWKGSIWGHDGQIIQEVKAIYGLDVLRSLAGHYGFHSTAFGRGFEARQCTQAIDDALKAREAVEVGA